MLVILLFVLDVAESQDLKTPDGGLARVSAAEAQCCTDPSHCDANAYINMHADK